MLRARVRSWPVFPLPLPGPESASSLWFDRLRLAAPHDPTPTTSGTAGAFSETLYNLSQTTAQDPDCDSASQTTFEDALTHISDETAPRLSIESLGQPQDGESNVPDDIQSTDSTGLANGIENGDPFLSAPPPRPLPPPFEYRMIPVKQQLTPIERLKNLNISPSLQLRADESMDFLEEDHRALEQLCLVLQRDWRGKLVKRRFPMFIPCLVSVTNLSNPPKSLGTYICIKGLRTEKQIRVLHNIVSKSAVKSHYAPLNVCYDTRLIHYAASEDSSHELDTRAASRESACGRLVRTKRDDGSDYLTTIGGVIKFENSFYVMTSLDHQRPLDPGPDEAESQGSNSSDTDEDDDWCSKSSTGASADEDFRYERDAPLILGRAKMEHQREDGFQKSHGENTGDDSHALPVLETVTPGIRGSDKENSHWRLIPALGGLLVPNYISLPPGIFGPSITSGYIGTYRTCDDVGSGTSVAINAGLSGISGGNMTGSPSFLFSQGKLQKVWTIKLLPGTNLRTGDSGSWVLDKSLRVLGSVLAISAGNADMVSLKEQLQQITEVLRRDRGVQNPGLDKAEVASTNSILQSRRANNMEADGNGTRSGATLVTGSPENEELRSADIAAYSVNSTSGVSATDMASLETSETGTNSQRTVLEPTHHFGLGPFSIMCLIINRTIGSGIFVQPTNVLASVGGSTGAALLLWIIAGLIVFVSAICWTELGLSIPRYPYQLRDQGSEGERRVSIPRSAGELPYMSYIKRVFLRPSLAHLAVLLSGLSPLIMHSTTIASNSLQFGLQTIKASGYTVDHEPSRFGESAVTYWAIAAVALCILVTNLLSRRFAIWMNNAFAIVKIAILVAIIGLGCLVSTRHPDRTTSHRAFHTSTYDTQPSSPTIGSITRGLSFAIYAYGGFDQPLFALHDIQAQRRKLARPAITALGFIIVLFPLVNMAFYRMFPPTVSSTDPSDVASLFFETVLGGIFSNPNTAKAVLPCVLGVSALGNVFAMIWTASILLLEKKIDVSPSDAPNRDKSWTRFGFRLPGNRQGSKDDLRSSAFSPATLMERLDMADLRFLGQLKTLWARRWGVVVELSQLAIVLATANFFLGWSPLLWYDVLSLVVAYSRTILPGIFVLGCLLFTSSGASRDMGATLGSLAFRW